MELVFRAFLILSLPALLIGGVHTPLYFVPADTGLANCLLLDPQGSARIGSGSLEFGSSPQRIDFLNARSSARCVLEETENRFSVFRGADSSKWRSHLPVSRRIRFQSVYPGVDIVYHGSASRLEYDFEVAAGASASQIHLGFAENARLRISPAGDLLVAVGPSTLVQHRPRARQGDREVTAKYAIERNGRHVHIDLGPYDRSLPLVIDPVLAWQTSVNGGGSAADTVAADRSGNMWILTDFPGINTTYTKKFGNGGNSRDLILLKVDPTGSQLIYAVLLGGSGYDFAAGLAIDTEGSAYITGSTTSGDFPVTAGAFQTSLPTSGTAAFIVKLAPTGDSLAYSTFLGGTGTASGTAIAVDPEGNAFVAGSVFSSDFPLTTGSWKDHFSYYPLSTPYALRTAEGGFVTKLNTTGTALLFSTLTDEPAMGMVIGPTGAVYIAGSAPAYLPALTHYTLALGNTGGSGTVVRRLTPDGSQSDLSVFIGCLAPSHSYAGLVGLDSGNNILVAGSTACSTFDAGTAGVFQPAHAPVSGNPFDGLIVKIAADASTVLAATFLGGSDVDGINALRVDSDDSILVIGGTSSGDFPVTPDALQPKYGGGAIPNAGFTGDGFFAHLSSDLRQLLYSTWLGGSGADSLTAMALDAAGNIYMGGQTLSGRHSAGAFSFGNAGLLWVLKVAHDAAPPPVISSVSPASLTAGSVDSVVQIAGLNFAQSAVVLLNGAAAPATFSSATQLTIVVSATNLATVGPLELMVLNPQSGASNVFALPVVAASGVNPSPRIKSVLPNGLPAGTPGRQIAVAGYGFLASTMAFLDGVPRASSLNADGTLSVSLTAADLASAGTLHLTLANPAPGGGVSAPAPFLVTAALVPLPPPGLSSISPSNRPAGTPATNIGFAASGVSPSAVARWNGVDHPIVRDSLGYVSFTASASDLAHAGTAEVTVYDKATGLESNPLPFWIPFAGTSTDMSWNTANGRLYLSGTKSVIVLNPDTGDAEVAVPVDIQIGRLAVSPDGGYLFAASPGILRRYQLFAAAPWLGSSTDLALDGLIDFAPMPGSPGSVAVYTNSQGEVAIYDGSVKRPSTARIAGATTPRALQFSEDGRTLYYATASSSMFLTTMPVTSAGLGPSVTKGTSADYSAVGARYFQGRIYSSSGTVFDAATGARVGRVPASSYAQPLVSPQAIVMLDTTSQYYCSLQAFDPVAFMPLWEERVQSGCDVNYYPYSSLFDIGGGRIAFRMTNAYIVKKPALAPLHSIYTLSPTFTGTFELGTHWDPDNELAVLSKQNALPVTAFLLADQADALSLGPAYQSNLYFPGSTPTAFAFGGGSAGPAVGQYTGKVPLLISNTTNPAVVETFQISVVNPYPLQASVSSLRFTCHVGGATPPPQSFLITKQGMPLGAYFQQLPYPSWLTFDSTGNGAPETITIGVKPAGLAAGTYTANVVMGYYSPWIGNVTVPVTLTVLGVPTISSVQDAESANLTVVPGEWVAIYGKNLSAVSRSWAANDFGSGTALPTSLEGASVQFGGVPAAIYYVSPTQLDVQVPGGLSGSVPVTIVIDGVTGAPFTVSVVQHAPSFFVYGAGSSIYPAATHLDGTLIGDPAVQPGATKAKPGEFIVLYVNGLATSPGGTVIAAPVPYTDPVAVTIGGQNASVSYAGLIAAGQFQVNVQIPPGLATRDYPIAITAGGQTSPGTVILPVQ